MAKAIEAAEAVDRALPARPYGTPVQRDPVGAVLRLRSLPVSRHLTLAAKNCSYIHNKLACSRKVPAFSSIMASNVRTFEFTRDFRTKILAATSMERYPIPRIKEPAHVGISATWG